METKLAVTFMKVAELGNITRSAEQLGYSQAAVTFQMQQLESDLGVQLFDRIGRGIQLTDAGRSFIPYAKALIEASNNADGFALDKEDPSGSIIMECSSSLAVGRMPDILIRFRKRYPRIQLEIRSSDSEDVMMRGLRENTIDFGYISNRRGEYAGCRKLVEQKERFVFVAAPDDPLCRKENVDIREILEPDAEPGFIVSDRDVSYIRSLEDKLRDKDIRINSMLDISSTSAIIRLVKRGYGRAILPEYLIGDELETGELGIIDTEVPELDVWSQLYCNDSKWINPQMKVFIDFMRSEV